jgi:hypothetical protein
LGQNLAILEEEAVKINKRTKNLGISLKYIYSDRYRYTATATTITTSSTYISKYYNMSADRLTIRCTFFLKAG